MNNPKTQMIPFTNKVENFDGEARCRLPPREAEVQNFAIFFISLHPRPIQRIQRALEKRITTIGISSYPALFGSNETLGLSAIGRDTYKGNILNMPAILHKIHMPMIYPYT